jgi:hypothetical protein
MRAIVMVSPPQGAGAAGSAEDDDAVSAPGSGTSITESCAKAARLPPNVSAIVSNIRNMGATLWLPGMPHKRRPGFDHSIKSG